MLTRTNNRTPLNFNVPRKSYDKHTYMTQYNGIKDSKNVVAVDQSSFADAKNMYVSDNNVLTSRPTIKITDKTNINKIWTFNDYILILDNSLLLSVYDKSMTLKATQQYSLASGATTFKINCIQVEDKIFIYTDLLVGGNPAFYCYIVGSTNIVDAIDYIYIPITKTVINGIEEKYETPNYLTSAEKTRFIYSVVSFVDFAKLIGKSVTINIDNQIYVIDNWTSENEKVLVAAYSGLSQNNMTTNYDTVDIIEKYGITIELKYNNSTKLCYVSFDGKVFYDLPSINFLSNSLPKLSEDGLCVFGFTSSGLARCKIASVTSDILENNTTFTWDVIKYCEREENLVPNMSDSSWCFGSFLSEDVYSYILSSQDPVRKAYISVLYVQWTDGLNDKHLCKQLGTYNTLSYHKMKFYKQSDIVSLPSQQVSPSVIGLLLDKSTSEALGFSEIVTGIGILFINDITSSTTTIKNGDIVYIKNASYKSTSGSTNFTNTGFISNPISYTDKNITAIKLQRWTKNGTLATKDTSTTALKQNDYIQFLPLNIPDSDLTEAEITGKIDNQVSSNYEKIGTIYKEQNGGKITVEYFNKDIHHGYSSDYGQGTTYSNTDTIIYYKNLFDTNNWGRSKVGYIDLPEEFTITRNWTYNPNFGNIIYNENNVEVGYCTGSPLSDVYITIRGAYQLHCTISNGNLYDAYTSEQLGTIDTTNHTITINLKYFYNSTNVYINAKFGLANANIGTIDTTNHTISLYDSYVGIDSPVQFTYSGNYIYYNSSIKGSFVTTKNIYINNRTYTYNLSTGKVYISTTEIGTISFTDGMYYVNINYYINMNQSNLRESTLSDGLGNQVGTIDILYCGLTLDTSYNGCSGSFSTNMNFSKYICKSTRNPIAPCRQMLSSLASDLYQIKISDGITNQELKRGDVVTFEDQSTADEDVSGTVYIDASSLKIDYKKAIQANYYPNGTSQPDINTLKENVNYSKPSSVYYSEYGQPDFNILFVGKTDYLESNYTALSYNIVFAAALKYNNSYYANVINNFNVTWKSNGTTNLPNNGSGLIKINCLEYNNNTYNEIQSTNLQSGYKYFARQFKINETNSVLITDWYYYDIALNKVVYYIVKNNDFNFASNYITVDAVWNIQSPIYVNNYIYYKYNNILYSSYIDAKNQISLDIVSAGDYNQVVFDSKAILDEYFLSFGNLVEITDTRRTEDDNREFLWYLPKLNEFKYVSNISDLHAISSEQVGVFLTDEIWVISLLKTDDNGIDYWKNTKTKLAMGVRAGGNTITSLNGSSTLLSTPRGITEMGLQDFVQSTDQEVTYLSDTIQYLYSYFKDKPIKFALYKYWIFAYTVESKQFLVLDSRYGTWWLWEFKTNIDTILTFNDIMYILSNNKLYKLNYNDDDDYYDDTDIIEWSFTSQKLHFGDINYYKHVKTINVIATGDGRPTCKITTKAFRNHGNPEGEKVVEIKIDDITTYVKVINAMKVNEFQFKFETDIYNVTQIPVKVDNISINYKIKGMVR